MSVHMLFSGCVYVSVKMYVSILMSAQIYFLVTSAEMCLYVFMSAEKTLSQQVPLFEIQSR